MQRGVSRSWLSWTAGLSMALPMVYGTLKTAHIADDLLFRGWRKTKVREPVFILTGPRSGTTRLHRLLAQDGDKFSYQKLYQSIFPSPTVYSLVKQASDLDEKLLGD